jgi:uncharacterized protein
MKQYLLGGILAVFALGGCRSEAPVADPEPEPMPDPVADIEAWRTERLERLQRPDGWLSLVGLHWVEPGMHTIGSAADNDIVLSTGPDRLGHVVVDDGEVGFIAAAGAGATLGGAPINGEVSLKADSNARIGFDDGNASLQLLERSGRFALRVRDAAASTRTGFIGIEHYPVDLSWRIDARFEPHPEGRTIDIVNVLGSVDPMPNPGVIVFERDGREYRIEAVDEGVPQLFLIFADRTNRNETYGAGRFVYVDWPAGGGPTVLDFNRAYNPPCAFTAYSTCPLPPPENRLDMEVTAGERRYLGPTE